MGGESTDILTNYLTKAKIKVVEDGLKFKYMPNDDELEACIAFGKNFGQKVLEEF